MGNRRLGDLLLAAKLVDEHQLAAALAQQHSYGGRIGEILIEREAVDEMVLYKGLARMLEVDLVELPRLTLPEGITALIPPEVCLRCQLLPIRLRDRHLTVATADPLHLAALDEVAFLTGFRVVPALAPAREVEWALRHYLAGDASPCPPPRQRARRIATADMQITHMGRDGREVSHLNTPVAQPVQMQPVAFDLPASSRPAPDPLDTVEAQVREAGDLLRLLIDSCVTAGLFTREEYLACLKRQKKSTGGRPA